MSKNTFLAGLFFSAVIFIAGWKYWAWLLWKFLRLRKKEQVFALLAKHRFIEITGPSGKGKSWLLAHLFKHLQGVKFTNLPTSQNIYTLNKKVLEQHMVGKWEAPNKWFYFLDDINLWQKWSQKEFGEKGYRALQDYLTQVGKLGGTFIWTNNGIEPEHVLKVQKNKTWKVLTYLTFKQKSLLLVQAIDHWHTSFWPIIIPIDNQEIQSFYDAHWNIPREINHNWLTYLAENLQAEELKAILQTIEEGQENLSLKDYDHNIYRRLLSYIKLREKEEAVVKDKSQKIMLLKKKLKKYGVSDQKITPQDIQKWEKNEKNKKTKLDKKKDELIEEDLDQTKQDPELAEEENFQEVLSKKPTKKNKKRKK